MIDEVHWEIALDLAVPLLIIPLLMLDRKDTRSITTRALQAN
jgi:hypothetical protein